VASPGGGRLLIIGWDGADWEILDDLIDRDCLPNLAALIREGARGGLKSTVPSHSWAAWSTFLTGMNPGSHGVFDFVEMDPRDPQKRTPISSDSIKAPTFVERLSSAGLEVRMANVPVTFPPFQINGRLISGVAIPQGAGFVYPPEWGRELRQRAPWPTNGMEWTKFEANPEDLVVEAQRYIERRTASFEVMLEGDWSVATCVYVSTDRLQHPFANHLVPSHPDYQRFADTKLAGSLRRTYELLDRAIERLRQAAGGNATIVLMSDHGFRGVTHRVNPNTLLAELGFQERTRSAGAKTALLSSPIALAVGKTRVGRAIKQRVKAPSVLDWSKTIAYQFGTGFGVSVNLEGREPKGVVPRTDYQRVREEIRDALLSFHASETNSAPVGAVWRREVLYAGPYVELAPDLIIEWNDPWDYQNVGDLTMRVDWPSGDHRREGILAATGPGVSGGNLGVKDIADVAATALAFCGVDTKGLDGRPITGILGTGVEEQRTLPEPGERRTVDLSRDEEESIAQHLRDLGYIE
jgi:predicted AlkP superfamily phosphohydrolase/phosphomutase